MKLESKSEKFKKTSGIYALKTFIFGILFILSGVIMTILLSNNWFILISVLGFLIVLWAISEGNPNSENL